MNENAQKEKALVVGGTSGMGLSAAKALLDRGYDVTIVGRRAPDGALLPAGEVTFIQSNLSCYDEQLFDRLSQDPALRVLLLTAGSGRVAALEALSLPEIKNLLDVNTSASIRIIRQFYPRIKQSRRFYCGIISSIAGLVSSPMFSVYAASKAALCRFTESVNIELEAGGTSNRILNIAPGSVPGTRFNGGENDPALISALGEQIVTRLLAGDTLFIPDYDAVYKQVLDRYQEDGHAFGMESYQYKKQSGRASDAPRLCVGYLSGTFDLFHIGHLNILRRAREQCDYLIAGVHESGAWKGKETFIPLQERMAIVGGCRYVDKVIVSLPEDSDVWDLYHYNKLFVGSDYKGSERFNRYEALFRDRDVEIVYFPYTKGTSSTQLRAALAAVR